MILAGFQASSSNYLEHHSTILVHAQHGTRTILHAGRSYKFLASELGEKFGMVVYTDLAAAETFHSGTVGWGEKGSETLTRGYG